MILTPSGYSCQVTFCYRWTGRGRRHLEASAHRWQVTTVQADVGFSDQAQRLVDQRLAEQGHPRRPGEQRRCFHGADHQDRSAGGGGDARRPVPGPSMLARRSCTTMVRSESVIMSIGSIYGERGSRYQPLCRGQGAVRVHALPGEESRPL